MRTRGSLGRPENLQILLVTGLLVILALLMEVLTRGTFLQGGNLQALGMEMPLLGLLSLAQVGPMILGGIDLSVVAAASLSGIVTGSILTSSTSGWMIAAAIAAGVGVSVAIGVINGLIVAFLEVPAIIATLGTMILLQGVALVATGGATISGFPPAFLVLGSGSLAGIPVSFLILLAAMGLLGTVLSRTRFGLAVYMMGANPVASLFSGVNVRWVTLVAHTLAGLLAGIASQNLAARFNAAQASYGASYLLLTVLACVLGGIDPVGGAGKVVGLLVAVIVLQVVSTGFNLLGFSSYLATSLWGIILIAVILINRLLAARLAR